MTKIIIGLDAKRIVRNGTGLGSYGRTLANDLAGIDGLDLSRIGPQFEYAPIFPERVNTEFVRVVSRTALRMRVWERGNGATLACGTGACAAVVAAVENGFCDKGTDVRVTLPGGDLTVNYTDDRVVLTGSANVVFSGTFEY